MEEYAPPATGRERTNIRVSVPFPVHLQRVRACQRITAVLEDVHVTLSA